MRAFLQPGWVLGTVSSAGIASPQWATWLWQVLPLVLVYLAMYKMEISCDVDRRYFRSSQVTAFKEQLELYLSLVTKAWGNLSV